MLQSLHIRNLAIVEDLRVDFEPGLNVITGETGAGKSVIIGALNLLLGERADKSSIRAGADSSWVDAVFAVGHMPEIKSTLDELGLPPCDDGTLIVRRQVGASGSGKNLVNDSPTTVQALKRLGTLLVDMHGPHDHQSLLSREFQLDLLDAFGHLAKNRQAYQAVYRSWQDLKQQRAALDAAGGDPIQQIEFLKFQVREIDEAHLENLDEAKLIQDHATAANAQRILELAGAIDAALVEDDVSAFNNLVQVQKHLQELGTILPVANDWKTEASALANQTADLARTIVSFAQRVDADPERLQFLETQLSRLHGLKRKYGPTLADVLNVLNDSRARLADLESRGERANTLEKQIVATAATTKKLATELGAQRRAAGKKLASAITVELRGLGFAHGAFEVTLTPAGELEARGGDEIEFGFAPNVGEPLRPLRAIASSGEMSRVMLAIKTVLADHDRVPVLVFDEIDANVGGEMANAVGDRLAAVARSHQVFCITHLPQVAVQGQRHYVVTKTVRNGRTLASIDPIQDDARAEEVARMLGGRDLTSVTIQHAREMIQRFGEKQPAAKPMPKPRKPASRAAKSR